MVSFTDAVKLGFTAHAQFGGAIGRGRATRAWLSVVGLGSIGPKILVGLGPMGVKMSEFDL